MSINRKNGEEYRKSIGKIKNYTLPDGKSAGYLVSTIRKEN